MNFTLVRPWPLRFLLLVAIAAPMFGLRMTRFSIDHETLEYFGTWVMYDLGVLSFIYINLRAPAFWRVIRTALIIGGTVTIFGVGFRFFYAFKTSGFAVGPIFEAPIVLQLTRNFLIFMAVYPYLFFAIHCFSARGALKGGQTLITAFARFGIAIPMFAISLRAVPFALRCAQHFVETLSTIRLAWSEENPDVYKPRYRADWEEVQWTKFPALAWGVNTIYKLLRAWLIRSLELLPLWRQEINLTFRSGT
jgi:hypothetical protein